MKAYTLDYVQFLPEGFTLLESFPPWTEDHVRARYLLILVRQRPPLLGADIGLGWLNLPTEDRGDYLYINIRPQMLVPRTMIDEAWRHLRAIGYFPSGEELYREVAMAKRRFNQTSAIRGWRHRRRSGLLD